jgi:DNA mismatch repair ATPase MutL
VLSKADFNSMDVVGQFNRGFIVARLCKADNAEGATDDLFIVDQHAADEKYNFETLQATTPLESQRLFSCVGYLYSHSCHPAQRKGYGNTNMQTTRAGADSS